MASDREPERAQTRRTIRTVDARVWALLAIAIGCLAVAALAFLALGDTRAPDAAGGGKRTTPAPVAIPKQGAAR
jgi:hypothetical protein